MAFGYFEPSLGDSKHGAFLFWMMWRLKLIGAATTQIRLFVLKSEYDIIFLALLSFALDVNIFVDVLGLIGMYIDVCSGRTIVAISLFGLSCGGH